MPVGAEKNKLQNSYLGKKIPQNFKIFKKKTEYMY